MLKIGFQSKNLNKAQFFGKEEELSLGESFTLPGGAQCKLLSGFDKGIESLTVISFVVENLSSISVGLVTAYLYDQLKTQNIDTIEVNGKNIPFNKESIESELKKYKLTKKND